MAISSRAKYRPQLARLVKSVPDGDDWLHEIKYDGYRIGCFVEGGRATLITRNGNDWTRNFPEICEAAAKLRVKEIVIDGEAAIELGDGRTSFHALQNAFGGGSRSGLAYFAFDLLRLDGEDMTRKPLQARKSLLEKVLALSVVGPRIRFADHIVGGGPGVFHEACRLGLEGIVSKRPGAPHRPGRNDDWVKTKCVARQEFVIGGYTDREGERDTIGALLVGFHDANQQLLFAGKVGTGFSEAEARALRKQLERIRVAGSPFVPRPSGRLGRDAYWVRPELVCEVTFTEWTPDQKLRHPSFDGLRRDKHPAEIVRERAAPQPKRPQAKAKRVEAGRPQNRNSRPGATEVAGIRISHPDRVLYPEIGLTKLDLARFYERIADWILPHVVGRPLTLVRCPGGVGAECWFMKHSNVWAPEALKRVRIQERKKIGEYLFVDSLPGLVGLVQMDILEIHTWNSTFDRIEQPDRIVFDLDPGSQVRPAVTVKAAARVRALLEALGLGSYVKTTGGAGLHVVVPIEPSLHWSECLEFARKIASALISEDSSLFTTSFAKAGREKKILVDYLRNNRTNTSVAAFSTRARPRAPVSVPLSWNDLKPERITRPQNVESIVKYLSGLKDDPWAGYWRSRQRVGSAEWKRLD
jgi:bifunctional non-homologous end joining protein LigD